MTQGWGYTPPEGSGSDRPGGSGAGEDDATRVFPPVTPDQAGAAGAAGTAGAGGFQHNPFQSGQWGQQDQQGQYQPQGYPQGQPGQQRQQGDGGGNGTKIALIIVVILLVIALGVLLATQWNNLFGSDDSDNGASSPATTTVVVPPDAGGSGDTEDSTPSTTASQARPATADLPGGVTPVNAAASNGEPTGNFNSIWLSGPTTPGFAENVRNAYVEAYRVDRNTDQTVIASSPTTGQAYTMSCSDQGSYIHCTGGNDAHVYIA